MKKLNTFIVIISLLFSGMELSAQKNLIVNGGFETLVESLPTFAPWIDVSNITAGGNVVDASGMKSGSYGYSWAKASQNDIRRGQLLKVTPGSTLNFSMKYKINGGGGSVSPAVPKPAFVGFYFYPTGEKFNPTAMQADGTTANFKKAEPTANTTFALKSTSFHDNVAPIAATEWAELKMDVTVPTGVDSLFLEIFWHRTTLYLDDISLIDPSLPAGLSKNQFSTLKVYPTIATSEINLTSTYPISEYTISDVSGKIILSGKKTKTDETINVSTLKSGFYLVNVKGQGVAKFMVKQ